MELGTVRAYRRGSVDNGFGRRVVDKQKQREA